MELTMSMFATQADYWQARCGLMEGIVAEVAEELNCPHDNEEILAAINDLQSRLSAAEKERDEAKAIAAALPENAADIRAFIGSNFRAIEYGQIGGEPIDSDVYIVSAHDLISCFLELHDNAPAALSQLRQEIIERCAKEGWMAASSDCEDRVAAAIRRLAEEAKEQENQP